MRAWKARTAPAAAEGGVRPSTFEAETILSSVPDQEAGVGDCHRQRGREARPAPVVVRRAAGAGDRPPAGPGARHRAAPGGPWRAACGPRSPRRRARAGRVAGDAGRHLGGSVAVEGDHPDPVGGYPAAKEDAEPGNQGRGLAAAGRGDELGRPIGQRGGRPLLGVERREQAIRRRCRGGRRHRHRSMMATAAYWAINDRIPGFPARCVERLSVLSRASNCAAEWICEPLAGSRCPRWETGLRDDTEGWHPVGDNNAR